MSRAIAGLQGLNHHPSVGVENKHRVIFSRTNTNPDSYARVNTCDSNARSIYKDEDPDSDIPSIQYIMDDSKDITRQDTENQHWFSCIGDENRLNFLCFCVGVSLSSAPVVSTLFWAPVVMDHHFAGIGNGCFFLVYAFTSLCLAKSLIQVLGCTTTFLVCMVGNIFYCLCFILEFTVLLKKFDVDVRSNGAYYPLVAAIGGFSQSLMWTAHVKYFNRCALLMLKSMNVQVIENLNRSLASTFAFVYFISLNVVFLSCVLVLFVKFSVIEIFEYVLPMYLTTVAMSALCLLRLDSMGDIGDKWGNFHFRRGLLEMVLGVRMMPLDVSRKLLCLIPYHVAWGCTNSFWVYYILGEVVSEQQGVGYVAVVCVIDFSTSLAWAYLSNKITKCASSSQTPMITWGWLCMTALGLVVLTLSNEQMGTRRRMSGFAITHGMARSVYENNHKALIANFFPEHETAAYSVTSFCKTLTAAITFFYYSFLVSRNVFGVTVIVTSALGILGCATATVINSHEQRATDVDGFASLRTSAVSSLIGGSERTSDSLMFVADYF